MLLSCRWTLCVPLACQTTAPSTAPGSLDSVRANEGLEPDAEGSFKFSAPRGVARSRLCGSSYPPLSGLPSKVGQGLPATHDRVYRLLYITRCYAVCAAFCIVDAKVV